MRGTFGNIRLRNALADGREGPYTVHLPDGEQAFIYDAAMRYRKDGVPLIVIAGREYGSGSSRDWAAKGTMLLGVRAVIAESFERIHRSNLVGMGVLPLQFLPGEKRRVARPDRPRGLHDPRPGRDGTAPAGHRGRALDRGRRRADASGRSRASTVRSRSSTTARAASCRPSCGASPGTERSTRGPLGRPAAPQNGAKPPGDPGASLIRTLVGAGRRPRPPRGSYQTLRRGDGGRCDAGR